MESCSIRVGESATNYFIYSCSLCSVWRCCFIYLFSYIFIHSFSIPFAYVHIMNISFGFTLFFIFSYARVHWSWLLACCEWFPVNEKYVRFIHIYWKMVKYYFIETAHGTRSVEQRQWQTNAYILCVLRRSGLFDYMRCIHWSSLWLLGTFFFFLFFFLLHWRRFKFDSNAIAMRLSVGRCHCWRQTKREKK